MKNKKQYELDRKLAWKIQRELATDFSDESIVDIKELFTIYNMIYFDNKIHDRKVAWSTKLDDCAGLFLTEWDGTTAIHLSEPLLKFVPKKELIATLLHEMIHAYLYDIYDEDKASHGSSFKREAERIKKLAKVDIEICHDYVTQSEYYQNHVWKCDGTCTLEPHKFNQFYR